jgi:hypothetical protein
MSADNVLVYEEQGAYRGRRLVLRLDGRVEQMTSDELAEALSTTRERLGQ